MIGGIRTLAVLITLLAVPIVALPATAAAHADTAPAASTFVPVPTARVFGGTVGTAPVVVPMIGAGAIATDATAVVVDVEVESPTAAGYVRVTPAGADAQVATQEFTRGSTISNLATVRLSESGAVQVELSAGAGRVFLDVEGYYTDGPGGDTFAPVSTFRSFGGTVGTTARVLPLAGVGAVPAAATAVTLNVEVQASSSAGYVRVTPAGRDAQVAAQEFTKGQTISNAVTVQLIDGAAQVKVSAGSATVFVDVSGYYSASASGSVFTPIDTVRASTGPVGTTPRDVRLGGVAGVPTTATAVVANAEVQSTTMSSYLRVTPYGQDAQVATQELSRGGTRSDMVTVGLRTQQIQAKLSAGTGTMFVDVSGYFSPAGAGNG
jgi:hypothetical protein